MNVPFNFALQTSTTPIGRLFDSGDAAAGYDTNRTLKNIAAAVGLGANAAARLAAVDLTVPVAPTSPTQSKLRIDGFSITCWASTNVTPKVDIGLYDTANSVFIALYEDVASSGAATGAGIQKTFGKGERGLYFPYSTTLLPAVRVTTQNATDGTVTVCGDISVSVEQR